MKSYEEEGGGEGGGRGRVAVAPRFNVPTSLGGAVRIRPDDMIDRRQVICMSEKIRPSASIFLLPLKPCITRPPWPILTFPFVNDIEKQREVKIIERRQAVICRQQ